MWLDSILQRNQTATDSPPHGDARTLSTYEIGFAVVPTRHAGERRIDPGEGRVRQAQLARDRIVAQTLGRAQQTPQELAVPIGDVDAQLLHQPSGQEDERRAAQGSRAGEVGPARVVRKGPLTLLPARRV